MSIRRAFKAKTLAYRDNEHHRELLTFGEDDSHKSLDLDDPFVCLSFVEKQVRKRTRFEAIEDYEVIMNTLTNDANGLVSDDVVVRPWRYPDSPAKYASA